MTTHRHYLAFLAAVTCLLTGSAAAQGFTRYQIAGRAVASEFNWSVRADVAVPAAGRGTITFDVPALTLPDGVPLEPWQIRLGVHRPRHDSRDRGLLARFRQP